MEAPTQIVRRGVANCVVRVYTTNPEVARTIGAAAARIPGDRYFNTTEVKRVRQHADGKFFTVSVVGTSNRK